MSAPLFATPAPRVFAAPPTAPFLRVLAQRLLSDLADPDNPFALAEALILTPNRRSARALIDAFAAEAGAALLLPAIRPIGDLDDDPDVWGPAALTFAAPEAIDPLRRRLELARLIRARDRAQGGAEDPIHALAGADELTRLLDAAAAAELADWSGLDALVSDANLAQHWGQSAAFLQIITQYWPQRLAADGLADPGWRRNHILDALADLWRTTPPQTPVIIAGSTGSLAAVRRLMQVVAHLPRGAVILPGLDIDLDDAAWEAIGPQHPQATLKATLGALGMDRRTVPLLPGVSESASAAGRRALIREALAPADITADWLARLADLGGVGVLQSGAHGMARIDCATEDEEAAVCALLLREALETPERTAALVTPSLTLARRTAAKLQRFGLDLPVAPGPPLVETEVGRLLRLLCDLVSDEADPVALAAVLRHPHVQLSGDRDGLIARLLAGPRRFERLADLIAAASAPDQALAGAIAAALASMQTAVGSLPTFAEAIGLAAEALCGGPQALWIGPDGETAIRALHQIKAEGEGLGELSPHEAGRTLSDILARAPAPAMLAPEHPRIAILGPLEARLQSRDLLILGGLNEGVWPQPPPEDAFLSRPMRAALGLGSPDLRIGQAAHDFAQFACAPDVVFTRALRQGDQPSVASRWLWRLETLLKAGGMNALDRPGPDVRALARQRDQPQARRPASAPRPALAPGQTITRISVTAAEELIRDPYAFYAKHILNLRPRRLVGVERDARERGTAIHRAIELFCRAGGGNGAALVARLDAEMRAQGLSPAEREIERARLEAAADVFAAWDGSRREAGEVFIEDAGKIALDCAVALTARADRLDVFADGVDVIDIKSGGNPSAKEVRSGIAPQLVLEAALVSAGGFQKLGRRPVRQIGMFRFRRNAPCLETIVFDEPLDARIEAAIIGINGLIRQYTDQGRGFLSRPRPKFKAAAGDFDLLARRAEWADVEGDE
jgi:ATP-dependent helicase/nuclease subunit B